MAQYSTGISIKKELFEQAKQYLNSQRPAGTFSGLVEAALEDFLKAQTLPQPKSIQPKKATRPIIGDELGRVDLWDINRPDDEPHLVAEGIREMEVDKYWRRYVESLRSEAVEVAA